LPFEGVSSFRQDALEVLIDGVDVDAQLTDEQTAVKVSSTASSAAGLRAKTKPNSARRPRMRMMLADGPTPRIEALSASRSALDPPQG
jgi:hypothetical protein